MTPTPEAITKSWENRHWLYCGDHGLVAFMQSSDQAMVLREFEKAWARHIEKKHAEAKP